MYEKGLLTESDLFNTNCAFTNMINTRDEIYGHQDDIEIIILELQEKFKQDLLKKYKSTIKKLSDKKYVDLAIKFVTYFDVRHMEHKAIQPYLDNPDFISFTDHLKTELEDDKFEPLTYTEYKKIIVGKFTEELDLRHILSKLKVFSAWWLLTD